MTKDDVLEIINSTTKRVNNIKILDSPEEQTNSINKSNEDIILYSGIYIVAKDTEIPVSIEGRGTDTVLQRDSSIVEPGTDVIKVKGKNNIILNNFSIDMNCGRYDDKLFPGFNNIGDDIEGLHPLDIVDCRHMILSNMKFMNNTYVAIRVYGNSSDILFKNIYFENLDCSIIFSQADAVVNNIVIDNCLVNGHYKSEPFSFYGNNAVYNNIKILNTVIKNKMTSAILLGGEKEISNTINELVISNCMIVNCVCALNLRNVNKFIVSNLHSYKDDNNLNEIPNYTGISLNNCNDGTLSNIVIDSSKSMCIALEKCKNTLIDGINITSLWNKEGSDGQILNLKDCENVNIDNLNVKSITPVPKSIIMSNCTNCNINLKEYITTSSKEIIYISLKSCKNVAISLPDDCEGYIEDDSLSYSNTNNNLVYYLNKNSVTMDIKYKEVSLEKSPQCDYYIFYSGLLTQIDLSNIYLKNYGKVITIIVNNNSGGNLSIKLTGGNIENASDKVIGSNEKYEFKLLCRNNGWLLI